MSRNEMKLMYPASWWGAKWREALPSGNGVIGAAVYGGVHKETVLMNHADLWWKGSTPELPDVSGQLPFVRELLQQEKAREADRVLPDALAAAGYHAEHAFPLPLGNLNIRMQGKHAFQDYCRTLNMNTGEVTVSWLDGDIRYDRVLFVSRSDDAIVYEIRSSKPGSISCHVSIGLHDEFGGVKPVDDDVLALAEEMESIVKANFLLYAARNDNGLDFGAVAKVTIDGGSMSGIDGALQISNADRVLITIKCFAAGERMLQWQQLIFDLEAQAKDYNSLLESHIREHQRLFHAMKFDLHADDHDRFNEEYLMEAYRGITSLALTEKMWSFGRYLLVSSTRKGGEPCHLYGLWCGEYKALWAFHMANENLQMIYWQALSGNMPELLLAVFDYMDSKLEDFRTNAKQLYGCRGIFVPAPTTPESGLLKIIFPHIVHWISGAGWVAQFYAKYYEYTLNEDFLRERALPFLYETALFYEDYMTVGEDGYYVISPSVSPENTPGNYAKENILYDLEAVDVMETTMNATMDFAIAKEVLSNLIFLSSKVGMYENEVGNWKAMLEKIPPYQVNEAGAIREWMHPHFTDNDLHRHLSHVYPLFPGSEIDPDSSPEIYNAFVAAVNNRSNEANLREQCGWSFMHTANSYARIGDGDRALECFEKLCRSSVLSNLFALCSDWRGMGMTIDLPWTPFQIDANMGWSAVVQDMLMISSPGKIRILPALPEKWIRGEAGPMLAHGGIEVSLKWDQTNKIVQVTLSSTKADQTIELVVFNQRKQLLVQEKEPLVLTFDSINLQ